MRRMETRRHTHREEPALRTAERDSYSMPLNNPGLSSDARRTDRSGSFQHGRAQSASSSARLQRQARASQAEGTQRKRPPVFIVVIIVVLLAAIAAGAQLCSSATPITVTVNGTQYALRGAKTMQVAIKESGLPVNPGDFISLQGNILQRGAGYPFFATVNDDETADPDYQLHDGDVITLTDGKDRVESYDAVEQAVPFEATIVGTGAVHTFAEGKNGVLEIRTGHESGEVVEKQTVDPQSMAENRIDPNVGNDKVIALTFDNGPSSDTEAILDILAENDAKATFFCLGTAIENGGADIVKRAASQGCQICTHSYDNAAATNGDVSLLTPDEQVAEIERGLQTIKDVLGYEPSRYVRFGSEDIPKSAILNVGPIIDAEIGWTIDTGDWTYMTDNDIYDVIMSAKTGAVVRMHDGGGSHDATVAALKKALPKLKEQGYTFITIDELMAYMSGTSGR